MVTVATTLLPMTSLAIGVVMVLIRWTPHPVIVTIGDNRDYIRVLLYSHYTTIAGWGGPPKVLIR